MENSATPNSLDDGFWVDDWFIEPMTNRAIREDKQVQLEPKVMDVLVLLAQHADTTVTKEQFMETVWTDTVVTDDVLSRCISQLRKVLGDDARDPDYIETIRKTGYRLIASVEVPEAEDSEAEESATEATALAADPSKQPDELDTTLDGLSDDLDSISSEDQDQWVIVAGAVLNRRNLLLGVGTVIALVLVVGAVLAFFPQVLPSAGSPSPLDAVPITSFPGRELDPALSPDGHQVAFTWKGPEDEGRGVYIMQRGTERPLRLSSGPGRAWSPTWSPDGQRIAFVRSDSGSAGIYTVSSIGGGERRVAHFPQRDVQSIAWSPDAERSALILSLQQRAQHTYSLYRLPLAADTLEQLTNPPAHITGDTNPALSPSGDRVAFTRTLIDDIQDVFIAPTGGGPVQQITSDSTKVTGVAWSADGQELIFASERGGTSGLWRIPASGGTPAWITTASEGTVVRHPSVAGAPPRLAYAQESGRVNIWKVRNPMDYTNRSTERLISSTQWDSNPDVAADGEAIAFVSRRSGYPEVWTASPTGTDLKQVTTLEGKAVQTPRWAPQSRQITFAARQQGHSDVYLIDPETLQPQRLTTHPGEDLLPAWSHDGAAIYFTSNRSGQWEIWRMPVEGGSPVRITEGGATAAQEGPDGSALYLVRPDTAGVWEVPLSEASFPIDLAQAPSLRQVIPSLQPRDRANWEVRPRGIYFLRRDPQSDVLAFYRFSTDRITPVSLLQDVPSEPSLAAAPDGEWFLHTRAQQRESDILWVEDFR